MINGHVGAASAWDKFHTFYVDHGVIDGIGYAVWYLHATDLEGAALQALAPGQCAPVAGGQVVATVGNVGTFLPHLHFEVRTYVPAEGPEGFGSRVIDPYGWTGSGADPWTDPLVNPQAAPQQEPLWVACGNGRVECGEQCDDGNTRDGDCCSATCQPEPAGQRLRRRQRVHHRRLRRLRASAPARRGRRERRATPMARPARPIPATPPAPARRRRRSPARPASAATRRSAASPTS